MSLRLKTILIIGAMMISLTAILYAASRAILLTSFTNLETQTTRHNMQRVLNVLESDLESFDSAAIDWAQRDATYMFMVNRDRQVIATALNFDLFVDLKLDFMFLVTTQGEIVFDLAFDRYNERQVAVPGSVIDGFMAHETFRYGNAPRSGLVVMPEGPLWWIAVPVRDTTSALPARGTMVWGRYLDAVELQSLAYTAQLSVRVQPFYAPNLPDDFRMARLALLGDESMFIAESSGQAVAGYTLLRDMEGQPALILRVETPRSIYRQGQSTVFYMILALVGAGIMFTATTVFLLERVIVARVLQLTGDVRNIGERTDLAVRVHVDGSDELSGLAGSINGMLDALERAQTELKQAQEQVARSARLAAAGEIAAGVAHQINNPLTTVIAESHLLLESSAARDDQYESLAAIHDAATRAGNVVQQLLDLSRTAVCDMTEFDVNESLRNVIALLNSQIIPHVERFDVELASDLPPIKASGEHLEDVVWINLLLNARDAVRERPDGFIRVVTSYNAADQMVEVTIIDNGVGIHPDNLPHIFDPFFTTKERGTGLGLATCHDVMVQHGGTIQVESEPGKGARFVVRLPALSQG